MSPPITLRPPARHGPPPPSYTPPPLPFLARTWTVAHSTLKMWRSAQNVRITYTPLPPTAPGKPHRLDDLVEYETPGGKSVKTVAGIDTSTEGDTTTWRWRGKGLLCWVTSHWEVLGWGEREDGERWLVFWFAATAFTAEGVDILGDRAEGVSEGLVGEIKAALGRLEGGGVAGLCEREMKEVGRVLPWKIR